jgi:hypothetical protein
VVALAGEPIYVYEIRSRYGPSGTSQTVMSSTFFEGKLNPCCQLDLIHYPRKYESPGPPQLQYVHNNEAYTVLRINVGYWP